MGVKVNRFFTGLRDFGTRSRRIMVKGEPFGEKLTGASARRAAKIESSYEQAVANQKKSANRFFQEKDKYAQEVQRAQKEVAKKGRANPKRQKRAEAALKAQQEASADLKKARAKRRQAERLRLQGYGAKKGLSQEQRAALAHEYWNDEIALKTGMSPLGKVGAGLTTAGILGGVGKAIEDAVEAPIEERRKAIEDAVEAKSAGEDTAATPAKSTEETDTVPTDTTAVRQNANLNESPATEEKASDNAAATIPNTHTVKEKDTLSAIAKRYGLTLQQLLERNDIEDPNYIRVGQTINLDPNGEKQKITGTFKKKKKKAAPAPTERRDVEEDGYYRTRPNKHGTEESYEDRRARAQREVEAYTNYRLARNKGEVEANKYYDDGEWLDQFDFR